MKATAGRKYANKIMSGEPRNRINAAIVRLKRHMRAIEQGRKPGINGRPITSTHPRAEYWRKYKQRKKATK